MNEMLQMGSAWLGLAVWWVVNVMAAAVRLFITYGEIQIVRADIATLIRFIPVLLLIFSIVRLLRRGRLTLAVAIFLTDAYFWHNRLTVFAVKPMTVAELIGNIGLSMLAIVLLRPQRPDRPLRLWPALKRKRETA